MLEQHRSYPARPLVLALLVGASALVASGASEFVSEVIPLKYVRASDVAAALIRMGTNSVGEATAASSPGAVLSPGTSASPPGSTPSNAWNDSSPRLQDIIARAAASGDIHNSGQSPIIADERTNSLLIYATREEMRRIKGIIARLDVVKVQVLIEALVIQVPARNSNGSGLSYLGGEAKGPGSYSFGAGALSSSNLLSVTRFVPIMQPNGVASQLSGFDYLAKLGNNLDLDTMVRAFADDSPVKILQCPRIQTSQGERATLFIGGSRPYPTSSYYTGGTTPVVPMTYGSGYSSIRQMQIGVTLDVTPSVMPDGSVVMDILQKLDSFEGSVVIQNVGDVSITKYSEARAKTVVGNRETLLLGGLIETVKESTRSGVPLLKDIPLLGALFGRSSVRTTRNELIVLIRPAILSQPGQAEVVSQK